MNYVTTWPRALAAVLVCAVVCAALVFVEFLITRDAALGFVTAAAYLFDDPLIVLRPHLLGLAIGFGGLTTLYSAGRRGLIAFVIAGALSMFVGARLIPILYATLFLLMEMGTFDRHNLIGSWADMTAYLIKGAVLGALGWRIADRSQSDW